MRISKKGMCPKMEHKPHDASKVKEERTKGGDAESIRKFKHEVSVAKVREMRTKGLGHHK